MKACDMHLMSSLCQGLDFILHSRIWREWMVKQHQNLHVRQIFSKSKDFAFWKQKKSIFVQNMPS